jgi:hypothetical protein
MLGRSTAHRRTREHVVRKARRLSRRKPRPLTTRARQERVQLPEPRRVRDRVHVKFVATHPCLICGRRPVDVHHIFAQRSALGRKVSDEFTVPLCRGHHRSLHRASDEAKWWRAAGIDPMTSARGLWAETLVARGRLALEILAATRSQGRTLGKRSFHTRQVHGNGRRALRPGAVSVENYTMDCELAERNPFPLRVCRGIDIWHGANEGGTYQVTRRSGSADLPLHSGHVPKWLADRMTRLGAVIGQAIVHQYGREEFLRRLAHPFWFQSFGAVMGMDWHSSGITTSVLGALKRGLAPLDRELGLYVCGGRGRHSRRTPDELVAIGARVGFDGGKLATASRLVAKVDSAAVQDGFELYLHGFIVAEDGSWVVVQQGMNGGRRGAMTGCRPD